MGTITKYATTLEQVSDSRFQTNEWSNLENGVGNTNVATSSKYTSNFVPQQLYAHDFEIQFPEQFTITNIRLEVKIKGSVKNTRVPTAFFDFLSINGHGSADYGKDVFSAQPNINISEAYNVISYSMGKEDAVKYNATRKNIENDRFGVILKFDESGSSGGVSVEWIRITITYDEPQYVCEIRGHTTPNDWEAKYLYKYGVGERFSVLFYVHNPITYTSNPKDVQIEIPLGLRIERFETSDGATFDENTRILHLEWVDSNGRLIGGSPYVKIYFLARTVGLKPLSIVGDSHVGSTTQYLYVEKSGLDFGDDESVVISSTDVRRCDYSDFHVGVRCLSSDNEAGYEFRLRGSDMTDKNENTFVSFDLDESRTSAGVSVQYQNTSFVMFNVPANKEVDIYFTVTFLPDFEGEETFKVIPEDTGYEYDYDYVSLDAYRYVCDVRYDDKKDIVFTNSRMVSVIDTGAYVYPMGISEYDNPLVMDKCTLRLSKFNEIDYIGCVPLEQTHFNPKSTYKDTLLDTYYKNKRYMGKKGAIDETITLNVRLPPKDVTTLQGLVAMDKPVPINANHKCFEGDALNHRGWAELYSITSQKTNPHWYKCELGVKYITHNLNTRFTINKGSRVSDYFLPELMTDVCTYGEDLTKNFYIETNGGYTYSKSIEDYHMRNMLALPNGKRFTVSSAERLSIKSQVNLNWYSTRNAENQDNNVSRVVRLIDAETGNAVLEYEWYDIDWSRTSEYTCRVICRILHKGAYKTILNRNLVLNNDVEYDPTQTGEIDIFGSELIFKIVADKVTIQDCGFSGKELVIEDINIQSGQYLVEVEFINNNIDHDTPDILNWIDISVKELAFSSNYSNYYSNILISPFPVPGKQIVFTRDSEEGTIFYLLDDGTECSYMINPYFQYHCGVDLQSRDGISIFNLDNNYQVVYITNGLVKLGINRFNGRMTLSKYDKYSKSFSNDETSHHFQLTKYDDININSFTDDKLELQVSDTIITMWRGHPYVRFAHPNEDILLTDKFIKVYADGVGDKSSDIPQFFNLVDSTNLLSECIASDRKIKSDCFSVTESEYNPPQNDAFITVERNGGLANYSLFTADCSVPYDDMRFIIDGRVYIGDKIGSGEQYFATHKLYHKFTTTGTHTVQSVYYKGSDYYFSTVTDVVVEDNGYKLTPTFPSTMYYLQHDYTCVLTQAGEPLEGETVVFHVNGLSYAKLTNENGVARLNNRLSPREEGDNHSQDSDYASKNIPYHVRMTYSEGGSTLATAEKDATILKGYANIDLMSSDYIQDNTKPKLTVTKGGYVLAQLTNNLDPSEDEYILPEEVYIKNKNVVLSVNGRDYTRITDNTGNARLNINLNAGVYDLRVSFAGDNEYTGNIKNFELRVVDN